MTVIKKGITLVLIALILFVSGCADIVTNEEPDKTPISPVADPNQRESLELELLFKYRGSMLAPETRTLDIAVSENVEVAILNALIQGPSKDHPELQAAVYPDTRVVGVKDMGEYLEVTLSKEFLYPVTQKDASDLTAKEKVELGLLSQKVAVFSVVNTLIQYGSASKVHILVDTSGSGIGERVTRKQLGMYGEDQDELTEPLVYDTNLMMTPNRVGEMFFNAVCSKNWEEAYSFVARKDQQEEENVKDEEIIKRLSSGTVNILRASLSEANVSSNGQSALLIAEYTYQGSNQNSSQNQGFPVQMIQQQEIWKVSYDSFAKLLGLQ
ncbi:MAG: GerMN domain-containing protein [Christensenellales bacterium]